jgi:hypothetical protein
MRAAFRATILTTGVLLLAACGPRPDPVGGIPGVLRGGEAILPGRVDPAADGREIGRDAQGRCWGRLVTPAVIETVTEQIMVQPAQIASDGALLAPAAFRTVTRQRILRERRVQEFEAICPEALTPDFAATLQRAMLARGDLAGPVTFTIDRRTEQAIRRLQARAGLDTAVLARATAIELGLVPLRPEEIADISSG